MAKLFTMFVVLLGLQAAMLLYAGGTDYSNDIWTFVTSLDNWGSTTFLISLGAIAAAIGLTGITSGSIFGFKTDFLIMGPAIAGLISIGAVFVQFGNILRDELVSKFACVESSVAACPSANFIVAVLIGPLAFYYAWTVIEWWRGKDY